MPFFYINNLVGSSMKKLKKPISTFCNVEQLSLQIIKKLHVHNIYILTAQENGISRIIVYIKLNNSGHGISRRKTFVYKVNNNDNGISRSKTMYHN